MAHLLVVQAVENRIRANFDRCPVFVENEMAETPSDSSRFIVIDFPWCRSNWVSAEEFEEEGGFRVLAAVERATGTHEVRGWLDEIAALFRGARFDGVQCYAPQSPVTDDQSDRDTYFRLEITVPYRFIIQG